MFEFFRHAKRLSALEERLEIAERELQSSKLDWDELYEKMRRMLGRVQKRAALVEQADQADDAPERPSSDQISEQIRARRRGVRIVRDG